MSDSSPRATCPVCSSHGQTACDEAAGIVLTAAEALLRGDKDAVVAAYDTATAFDFHVAVGLFVTAMDVIAVYTQTDLGLMFSEMRREINAALCRVGDSDNPNQPRPA